MRASPTITIQSSPPADEDGELVLAAQKNPPAFQALYDRWAVSVYQYFYHRTGEMVSAEDLTSQLFLAAYQALPRYRHRGRFAAWLFSIARNLAKEHYRKLGREVPLEMAQNLISSPDPAGTAYPAVAGDPAIEFSHEDEIRRLIRLVHSLPEQEQELIRLRYVAELSFADMAIILGKRREAVKKSLYRLQARLQALLQDGPAGAEP